MYRTCPSIGGTQRARLERSHDGECDLELLLYQREAATVIIRQAMTTTAPARNLLSRPAERRPCTTMITMNTNTAVTAAARMLANSSSMIRTTTCAMTTPPFAQSRLM